MSTHLSRTALIATLLAALVTATAFAFLNDRFGGPSPHLGKRYELSAHFADSQQVLVKSLVMVNGVKIGEVTGVHAGRDGTHVTFSVDKRFLPLHRDATVRVGTRTAFGETYLHVDRGSAASPDLPAGSQVKALASVEGDEALEVFDSRARWHARATLGTIDRAVSAPGATERLHRTIEGLDTTIDHVHTLTTTLRGQQDEIAALIDNAGVVVTALADRESALRRIVGSGRTVLTTLAGQRDSLAAALAAAKPLLATGRTTLAALPPLVAQARPVVRDGAAAARAAQPALEALPGTLRDTVAVADRIPAVERRAEPMLREMLPLVKNLRSGTKQLIPAMQNLIPLARWLEPRGKGYAAALAHLSSATAHGDSDGHWLRLFAFLDLSGTLGGPLPKNCDNTGGYGSHGPIPSGACFNAYPEPGDAAHPQPYKPGSYERLQPYPIPKEAQP